MKDIIITSQRIKKELTLLLACFAIAFLMNIVAIFIYMTPWVEAFTQIGYVVILTISFYILLALIRLVIFLFRALIKRKTI